MKKILLFLIIFVFVFVLPSEADNSAYVSLDEYSRDFEMGLNEEDEPEEDTPFVPVQKEKITTETPDVIRPESAPIKLNIEKLEFLDPYREIFSVPEARVDLLKANNFTFFSNGTKELSDYMTDNFKSTLNAAYKFNKNFSLQMGHEVWYVNPNASVGAKKFYFNPRLNLSDRCYLDYINKYNHTSKNYEHEVGLNYRPRLFRDTASFGVKATATVNSDTSEIQSKKLKFTTDFYIY